MRKLFIISILMSLISCNNSDDKRIYVYIDDGSIQCESSGLSVEETAQPLINYGVDVFESSCAYITGIAIAAQCGLGDSNINIHLIDKENVIDAQNIGYEPVSTLEDDGYFGYETVECD